MKVFMSLKSISVWTTWRSESVPPLRIKISSVRCSLIDSFIRLDASILKFSIRFLSYPLEIASGNIFDPNLGVHIFQSFFSFLFFSRGDESLGNLSFLVLAPVELGSVPFSIYSGESDWNDFRCSEQTKLISTNFKSIYFQNKHHQPSNSVT